MQRTQVSVLMDSRVRSGGLRCPFWRTHNGRRCPFWSDNGLWCPFSIWYVSVENGLWCPLCSGGLAGRRHPAQAVAQAVAEAHALHPAALLDGHEPAPDAAFVDGQLLRRFEVGVDAALGQGAGLVLGQAPEVRPQVRRAG